MKQKNSNYANASQFSSFNINNAPTSSININVDQRNIDIVITGDSSDTESDNFMSDFNIKRFSTKKDN